jgi:hypothetical protein
MPKSAGQRLGGRGACGRRGAQETAKPRHVFVVLREEDGQQALRGNQPHESAGLFDDCQPWLLVAYRLPRRAFLVGARSDGR